MSSLGAAERARFRTDTNPKTGEKLFFIEYAIQLDIVNADMTWKVIIPQRGIWVGDDDTVQQGATVKPGYLEINDAFEPGCAGPPRAAKIDAELRNAQLESS